MFFFKSKDIGSLQLWQHKDVPKVVRLLIKHVSLVRHIYFRSQHFCRIDKLLVNVSLARCRHHPRPQSNSSRNLLVQSGYVGHTRRKIDFAINMFPYWSDGPVPGPSRWSSFSRSAVRFPSACAKGCCVHFRVGMRSGNWRGASLGEGA
jgi:hypothetical protein